MRLSVVTIFLLFLAAESSFAQVQNAVIVGNIVTNASAPMTSNDLEEVSNGQNLLQRQAQFREYSNPFLRKFLARAHEESTQPPPVNAIQEIPPTQIPIEQSESQQSISPVTPIIQTLQSAPVTQMPVTQTSTTTTATTYTYPPVTPQKYGTPKTDTVKSLMTKILPFVKDLGDSKCPVGTYVGGQSCYPCPVDTFGIPDGCMECKENTFSLPGQSQCSVCPLNSKKATNCEACPTGTYARRDGTECFSCPRGYSQSAASVCAECLAGTFASEAGSTSCSGCPANYFSSGTRAAYCEICIAGKSSVAGATSCTDCPSGHYSLAGENCQVPIEGSTILPEKDGFIAPFSLPESAVQGFDILLMATFILNISFRNGIKTINDQSKAKSSTSPETPPEKSQVTPKGQVTPSKREGVDSKDKDSKKSSLPEWFRVILTFVVLFLLFLVVGIGMVAGKMTPWVYGAVCALVAVISLVFSIFSPDHQPFAFSSHLTIHGLFLAAYFLLKVLPAFSSRFPMMIQICGFFLWTIVFTHFVWQRAQGFEYGPIGLINLMFVLLLPGIAMLIVIRYNHNSERIQLQYDNFAIAARVFAISMVLHLVSLQILETAKKLRTHPELAMLHETDPCSQTMMKIGELGTKIGELPFQHVSSQYESIIPEFKSLLEQYKEHCDPGKEICPAFKPPKNELGADGEFSKLFQNCELSGKPSFVESGDGYQQNILKFIRSMLSRFSEAKAKRDKELTNEEQGVAVLKFTDKFKTNELSMTAGIAAVIIVLCLAEFYRSDIDFAGQGMDTIFTLILLLMPVVLVLLIFIVGRVLDMIEGRTWTPK